MKTMTYENISKNWAEFDLDLNDSSQLISVKNPSDPYQMNWVRGNKTWGTITCDLDLSVSVTRTYTEQHTIIENYNFRNETAFDIYTMGNSLGVYTPFPDYYTDAAVCMTQCCNTHIWCGGSSSYIMALRMGGEGPNLGMILRKGSLQGYSVERMASTNGREEELSNHRGDFILHPENLHLRPGEEYTLSWELFWFHDKKDFRRKLLETPGFIYVEASEYLLLDKKPLEFFIHMQTSENEGHPKIFRGGREICCQWEKGRGSVCETPTHTGEYQYEIHWKEQISRTTFLVMSDLWELAGKRCTFITEHQQCRNEASYLNGAYLIYDNEEHQQYYEHLNDHNGGRERVGMGILLACYLQRYPEEKMRRSLDAYLEYVLRELFDEETGEVFNDAPRCRDFIRLYNYPWMSRFFLEMYQLTGAEIFLDRYYKSVEFFYNSGGGKFYAIGMPMYESVQIFKEAGRGKQAEQLLRCYQEQGEFILSCGKNYPAHEVDYEQSIVAPAAIYMCELYLLTKDVKYRQEAERQLQVLELFQGFQPDYHMNEVAVRHWDGYWFGKNRCLGDTYPHYWSALSGYAYRRAEEMGGLESYAEKASNTLRAVLSLIKEDGSASCAMVYPMSVNGKKASFYDPWANDQDWGLYFALKYL